MRRGHGKGSQGLLMGTKLGVGPGAELAAQSLPGCMMVATGGVASHVGPTAGTAWEAGLSTAPVKSFRVKSTVINAQ